MREVRLTRSSDLAGAFDMTLTWAALGWLLPSAGDAP
jgi:hypothetical protein